MFGLLNQLDEEFSFTVNKTPRAEQKLEKGFFARLKNALFGKLL